MAEYNDKQLQELMAQSAMNDQKLEFERQKQAIQNV